MKTDQGNRRKSYDYTSAATGAKSTAQSIRLKIGKPFVVWAEAAESKLPASRPSSPNTPPSIGINDDGGTAPAALVQDEDEA